MLLPTENHKPYIHTHISLRLHRRLCHRHFRRESISIFAAYQRRRRRRHLGTAQSFSLRSGTPGSVSIRVSVDNQLILGSYSYGRDKTDDELPLNSQELCSVGRFTVFFFSLFLHWFTCLCALKECVCARGSSGGGVGIDFGAIRWLFFFRMGNI